jgi:hypothetical protein
MERMYFRIPAATVGSLTVQEMRRTGNALRGIVADGATALMIAHGLRGELWRETGAEYLPPSSEPQTPWGTEFVLMGRGAHAASKDARVIDDRVCAFAAPPPLLWRVRAGDSPPGWQGMDYDDSDWVTVALPRRLPSASRTPASALAEWRSPALSFRGRVHQSHVHRRVFSVSLHTTAAVDTRLTSVYVNGESIRPLKERSILTSFYRNREWLLDLTSALRLGDNVIALAIQGSTTRVDVDVFEVPCTDEDWYY